MEETREFEQLVNRVSQAMATLPARAATEAVNFSKERFRSQNWVGDRTEPWAKRKSSGWGKRERPGRAILVDSGRLKRSIRTTSISSERATVGTDVPYARAHNEGVKTRINQHVRAHARRTKRGTQQVKGFMRSINQNIPKRQFIGVSPVLERQIERTMIAELSRALKST